MAVVLIRTAGGRPVPDAYVSFVPPDRPSWRPLAEAVAMEGRATVCIPPGLFKVLAGARGLQDSVRAVNVTGATEIAFELSPSVTINGIVQDGAERPVNGGE